jgi:L-ribulokinase
LFPFFSYYWFGRKKSFLLKPRQILVTMSSSVALGLDFGTESVRALLVDRRGLEHGSSVARYRHGQITEALPGVRTRLPPFYALQHPQDWLDSSARAVKAAIRQGKLQPSDVSGIGVCFTSCTMLPTLRDGTPLCQLKEFSRVPLAWPKLWKHHGAQRQADHINEVARRREERFLNNFGGTIGLEWFFPKILETLELSPEVYSAADVWLEAGDWFVWQLTGGPAEALPRSKCQAGYKAMWSRESGYPSTEFFSAVHPELAHVVRDKLPGRMLTPGQLAGRLTKEYARRMGLLPGVPVSAAIIDAHSGVPGSGASEAGTLVLVLGTSGCYMLNAKEYRSVPGIAGVVEGGILPGLFGYETGQAAVGDAFDWLRQFVGQRDFATLNRLAGELSPGADGVRCLDWLNGCRTPLMNDKLRGAFGGLTLQHRREHAYRALMEASAFGVRWIVELLREHGVPVNALVATGGLPHRNRLLVQIYADVLDEPITIHPSQHGPALGAAILGALAAGEPRGFRSTAQAVKSMAAPKNARRGQKPTIIRPNRQSRTAYDKIYEEYRKLAAFEEKRVWDDSDPVG